MALSLHAGRDIHCLNHSVRVFDYVLPSTLSGAQAAANAKNNYGASKSALVISECFADGGPCYKRVRPRAQGRYVRNQ